MTASAIPAGALERAARPSSAYLARPPFGRWKASTPIEARAAAAGAQAAEDQWAADNATPAPEWLGRRLAPLVKRRVLEGADPILAVVAARFACRFAAQFVEGWTIWPGDVTTPPARTLATAVHRAVDLAIQGKPWDIVGNATHTAGMCRHPHVEHEYGRMLRES